MSKYDYSAIGQRIKEIRKMKGLNQSELAQLLNKSLRTVQKYETGEIEFSISVVNDLSDVLEVSPTYLLGYESSNGELKSLSDVMDFLFKLEAVSELDFRIDVRRPPHYDEWECSITFDGKHKARDNSALCLFLESWELERDDLRSYRFPYSTYTKWKNKTLAYYANTILSSIVPEEIDNTTRIQKRNEYLTKLFESPEKE